MSITPRATPTEIDWRSAPDWYDANAAAFEAGARDLPTHATMRRFLKGLPAGGKILDIGCGTGRDAARFLDLGYEVEAVDPSGEMCEATLRTTGGRCDVRMAMIQDMPQMAPVWDGIWMMASLLHVPKAEWPKAFDQLSAALRPGGRIYACVKVGAGEVLDSRGRPMSFATTTELVDIMQRSCVLKVRVNGWSSEAVASDGSITEWANATLTRI